MDINDLSINPVSKSALVGAALHKLSSEKGLFPWELLKLDEPGKIRTSYTISIDKSDQMYDEIAESPYPIIKVKMGFDDDELLVNELKKISGKRIRIDANGGWEPEKAESMIHCMDKLDVEIIEQPTKIEHIRDWKYIKGSSKVSFFIDEGLNTIEDYHRYSEYVDGVNIKMSKSGGIIEARNIAAQAKKDKIKVMLGCMVESSVGISQAVYLSSLADYFDLDGPLLLKEDIAIGIDFNLERITIGEDIIGGPRIKREYLYDKTSQ